MQKKRLNVQRMVVNSMLMALYVVLNFMEITLGGLKFSFSALPVVICALAFGPVDGLIVGFFGEFIAQLLGPYGLTPTTLLWVAPAAVRGLFIGTCVRIMRKKLAIEWLYSLKNQIIFYIVCTFSGIIVSCMNTFTFYVDSKMFGYYSYAAVFGVFWARIFIGVVSSAAMGIAAVPVTLALRKAKLIQ